MKAWFNIETKKWLVYWESDTHTGHHSHYDETENINEAYVASYLLPNQNRVVESMGYESIDVEVTRTVEIRSQVSEKT